MSFDQESDENCDGESFDQAFARWCGFRGGVYFQDQDALGLARDHDQLHRMQNRIARELDVIADSAAAALPEQDRIRRQDLRRKRWAMRLIRMGMGSEITEPELTEKLFKLSPSDRIREAQQVWGTVCLDAFLTGDFELFTSLRNAAKAYGGRKEERTKAAQVIDVAWSLRCSLNRDPSRAEVKAECKEIGIELSDWRKIWGNARLTFLLE